MWGANFKPLIVMYWQFAQITEFSGGVISTVINYPAGAAELIEKHWKISGEGEGVIIDLCSWSWLTSYSNFQNRFIQFQYKILKWNWLIS